MIVEPLGAASQVEAAAGRAAVDEHENGRLAQQAVVHRRFGLASRLGFHASFPPSVARATEAVSVPGKKRRQIRSWQTESGSKLRPLGSNLPVAAGGEAA